MATHALVREKTQEVDIMEEEADHEEARKVAKEADPEMTRALAEETTADQVEGIGRLISLTFSLSYNGVLPNITQAALSSMSNSPSQLHQLFEQNPELFWYLSQQAYPSDEVIFEHILNYGTWQQVQTAIKLLGMNKAAAMFKTLAKQPRSNLKPQVKHYFTLYFAEHAPESTN